MADQYEDLQQSYGRCLRDKRFIERFYEVFMASHPAIPPMFARTDFGAQRVALRRGISVAILHAAGSGLSRRTTEQMADVHARHGRAPVDPALYPYWIDSLLAVIAETDPEATPALLARWRTAMGVVCATFTERYPGH
ncbi:globin domain-containing protein [Thermomonas haemolytica]|uniref:Hemoglobin-like flavoprotein n=1 Tax=Thermomonas haemolytica TaxID=141949 RepID=A0A4V2V2T2_9GAMM|nr:globin domain-containing protein [Thermomonas haemolytica]TCT26222.1 hemoglobin-like flavoprotein [Thermomonas haemolytica]TNY29519.1 globin [Thermomonas haemolytica]